MAHVFAVGFGGTTLSPAARRRLRAHDWGVVLIERGNYAGPTKMRVLTAGIRTLARRSGRTPPLVAANQIGGAISAFPNLAPIAEPLTTSPSQAAREARRAARQLRTLGVSMNLAPDADLSESAGPALQRSYSDDPAVVSRLTAAAVRAYAGARVASVPGRFPGEGGASQDPALGAATVGVDLATLRSTDVRPFAAVAATAPAIQMSNALYAAWDGVTPASLLPDAYTLLRRDLHFRGVAVTGDLTAAAAATGGSTANAAVDALQAGADLLVVPGGAADQEAAFTAVLDAVRQGTLPRARLAQALARVTDLQLAYG